MNPILSRFSKTFPGATATTGLARMAAQGGGTPTQATNRTLTIVNTNGTKPLAVPRESDSFFWKFRLPIAACRRPAESDF